MFKNSVLALNIKDSTDSTTVNRSVEYKELIEQLKKSITKTGDIATMLMEQGKHDGLSNGVIRQDIELALDG
jgi:hypothetical protein